MKVKENKTKSYRKTIEIVEAKSIGISSEFPYGGFEGYANTFNVVDRQGEMTLKGAFANCLESLIKDGFVALNHDWQGLPIGMVVDAREDDIGLYVVAKFHDTALAQDTRKIINDRIADGKSVKMSIGYRVIQATWADDYSLRVLKELEVFEFSIVNVPANPDADVTSAKSIDELEDIKDLNSLLAGTTFKQHTETLLDAIGIYLDRYKSIQNLRLNEGRKLSEEHIGKLKTIKQRVSEIASNIDAMFPDETAKSDEVVQEVEPQIEDEKKETTEETPPVLITEPTLEETTEVDAAQTDEEKSEEIPSQEDTESESEKSSERLTEIKMLEINFLEEVARSLGVEI